MPHSDPRLIVISNRLGNLERPSDAGGLAVGIADALAESGGIWFGAGNDQAEHLRPDEFPTHIERQGNVDIISLTLPRQQYSDFYNGYANSVLWPLFHYRGDLVDFRNVYLDAYHSINERFAGGLSPYLRDDDTVWVHDYHLIPLARAMRRRNHANRIGFFLHVPFPSPELFTATPRYEMLIRDFLSYDLVGFQTNTDLDNFRRVLEKFSLAEVDSSGTASFEGRQTVTGCFPIGIDVETFSAMASEAADDVQIDAMRRQILGIKQVIGVDRLDYSKGLPNRMDAFARMLEQNPELQGSVTYLQVASPTREGVNAYVDIRSELETKAGAVNGRYADLTWTPIRYIYRSVPRNRLAGLYRASQVGLVTPLRDGMNLVAKEYIAAQDPGDPGVLVLSRFAGASDEMPEALIVNPYDVDQVANAIATALSMSLEERSSRHAALLRRLKSWDARFWRESFLSTLVRTTQPPCRSAA